MLKYLNFWQGNHPRGALFEGGIYNIDNCEETLINFLTIKNNVLPCGPAISPDCSEQTPVKLHCTFGGGFLKIFQSLRGHLFKMRDFKERCFSE